MRCFNCNQEIADDSAYCSKCGTKIVSGKKKCSYCEKMINQNAEFCSFCGKQQNRQLSSKNRKIYIGLATLGSICLICTIVIYISLSFNMKNSDAVVTNAESKQELTLDGNDAINTTEDITITDTQSNDNLLKQECEKAYTLYEKFLLGEDILLDGETTNIKELNDIYSTDYSLVDLNKDGVEELIINSAQQIFKYENNMLSWVNVGSGTSWEKILYKVGMVTEIRTHAYFPYYDEKDTEYIIFDENLNKNTLLLTFEGVNKLIDIDYTGINEPQQGFDYTVGADMNKFNQIMNDFLNLEQAEYIKVNNDTLHEDIRNIASVNHNITKGSSSIPSTNFTNSGLSPTYEVVKGDYTWEEAKVYCESKGGELLSIYDESEQKWAESLFDKAGIEVAWLNIEKNSDGNWVNRYTYKTEENGRFTTELNWNLDSSYSKFHTGEPNNADGVEGVIGISKVNGEWGWNDFIGTVPSTIQGKVGFICDYTW